MRPRTSWIIAACCFALLCGAMAWTTHSMLGMERERGSMSNEASVQEWSRLALWRMEFIASTLVIEESARPPEQYRPFAEPEALVDNKTNTPVKQGELVTLSPLLREPPEYVLLHFEMDANGLIRSPQVPKGRDLMICQSIGVPPAESIAGCAVQLNTLSSILDKGLGAEKLKKLRATLQVPSRLTGNRAWLWSANEPPRAAPAPPPPNEKAAEIVQTKAKPDQGQQVQQMSKLQQPLNYAQQAVGWKPEDARAQQSEFNADENRARADSVKSAAGKTSTRRIVGSNNLEEMTKKAASKDESPRETFRRSHFESDG